MYVSHVCVVRQIKYTSANIILLLNTGYNTV